MDKLFPYKRTNVCQECAVEWEEGTHRRDACAGSGSGYIKRTTEAHPPSSRPYNRPLQGKFLDDKAYVVRCCCCNEKLKIWTWIEFHQCACTQCKKRSPEWAVHIQEQQMMMERRRKERMESDLMKMREKDIKDIVQKLEIEKPKK